MRYIKKKYIEEEEVSELDLELVEVVLGECKDEDYDYDIISNRGFDYSGEGDAMEIDNLIEILQDFKKNGANYVEMMNHCDHHGYVFSSLEIRKATKEDIQAEKEKYADIKADFKKEKIKMLEVELAELKKEE